MEPIYYTRTALSGWIFMAIVFGSLWCSNSPHLIRFIQLVSNNNLSMIVLGAIVGISAPPAFGFLLDRVTSLILWPTRMNIWKYKCLKAFEDNIIDSIEGLSSRHKGAIYQVFFYSFANQKLIDWTRRRRSHMFASLSSIFAILLALIAVFLLNSFSLFIFIVSIFLIVLLVLHVIRESYVHKKVISVWTITLKSKISDKFIDDRIIARNNLSKSL